MRTLFLAWQDPSSRSWYPIGRLQSYDGSYTFGYTKGAEQARDAGFEPLMSFPDLNIIYRSETLFPMFSNRLLPHSRPEYIDHLVWLNIQQDDRDPIAVLSRNGGQRVTDTLEVFPGPERNEYGEYEIFFLVHGLSHMPKESILRAEQLKVGDKLLAMHDMQNPKDPHAVALRTEGSIDRDLYFIGYCPRYLRADFRLLLDNNRAVRITVERVNPPPAPMQFRVLCRAVMDWPDDLKPLSSPEYNPLVPRVGAAENSIQPGHYRA